MLVKSSRFYGISRLWAESFLCIELYDNSLDNIIFSCCVLLLGMPKVE